MFGLSKSTVIKLAQKLSYEILGISHEFIQFPQTAVYSIQLFKIITSGAIPQVFGFIDRTLIEILKTVNESPTDYFS